MRHAILSLFLVMLAACSAQESLEQTEILEVPVLSYIPIDPKLTERVRAPELPEGEVTYGDVTEYALGATGAVEECNEKLDAIEELQDKILDN